MQRYELIAGASAKFWEVGVEAGTLTVRFGRIGTEGQTKEKEFVDAAAATKEKDKLVREKTGKGYALAGTVAAPVAKVKIAATGADEARAIVAEGEAPGAETTQEMQGPDGAASPTAVSSAADAPAMPTSEGDGLLFAAKPLPTRTRPGSAIDAKTAWSQFRGDLAEVHVHDKLPADMRQALADDAPRLDAGTAVTWIEAILTIFLHSKPVGWKEHSLWLGHTRTCLEGFLRALVATSGALVVAEAAARLLPTQDSPGGYRHFSWSAGLQLALRAALVHAPEDDYDKAVALLTRSAEQAADWPLTARYAFILADDRPARHTLQPLAVLEAAEAAGVDFTADNFYSPLIADAPPAEAERWRVKRGSKLYLKGCAIGAPELAATLIAVAGSTGAPAVPSLGWLLAFMSDAHRTTVAKAMLETREPGALATLLPVLHEKWIRPAFDAAGDVYPVSIFRQALVLLAGRTDPALLGRIADTIDRFGTEQAIAWARDVGPKATAVLEKLVASRDVAAADKANWPRVLRDPPWRQKTRARDDIVLALAPIATPIVCEPAAASTSWRSRNATPLDKMERLGAFIAEAESKPKSHWVEVPEGRNVPTEDSSWEYALSWLVARFDELRAFQWGLSRSNCKPLYGGLERQPEPLALALWEATDVLLEHHLHAEFETSIPAMVLRFGEKAVPGLVALVESDPLRTLPLVGGIDHASLAPLAARALLKLKKARVPALAWLRGHRATAFTRLLPDAVGRPGPTRQAAEHALRFLVAETDEARVTLDAVVARYADTEPRIVEAIAQVLARDPFARVPAKVAKVPGWVVPSALARPYLVQGDRRDGGALPDEAVQALCEMLSFTDPDDVYAGIPSVKEACTPASLAAFAWDLFSAWIAAGAPANDGWALRAVGWLGDDACARDLTRLIRRWPGEAAHARAVTGLDVLADIGSDVALMNLNGIAEKLKFKGLQEKAQLKIALLAEARGLSPEELSDRLAPDLDLDERGGLDLDFGPRVFRAGFDEALKPWVKDASGQRLKDLPKPIKSDDAEKSAAAVARWGALKKDARAVASLQVARLEAMLATSRRVRPEVFQLFFAAHPLVRHLTQRLLWATFADADPRTGPTAVFRVADDLGFTDAADEPIGIDVSTEAEGLIGLVHPLHMPDGGLTPWGVLFGDYEIAQPFPQLGREVYALSEAEKAAVKSDRFDGILVEAKRLRGMGVHGWPLGSVADHGVASWIEHRFAFPDGEAATASLLFETGIYAGAPEAEDAEQTLREITFEEPWSSQSRSGRTFGALDPVTASELLRGPSLLAETRLR